MSLLKGSVKECLKFNVNSYSKLKDQLRFPGLETYLAIVGLVATNIVD